MVSYYEPVHRKLIELAQAGPFYSVDFVKHTAVVGPAVVSPIVVEANEVRCEFGLGNVRNRRTNVRGRQLWIWELILSFPQHVSGEEFEAVIGSHPTVIPADGERRSIALNLRSVTYEHPPRANPTNGSRLKYEIEAAVAPL